MTESRMVQRYRRKDMRMKFFSAATRYEDKGNRRFKAIEMSLPNELNLEQNREIVDRFIGEYLQNHYYAYAIHEKNGAISGERHPHVHIMFSERLIDDVEKMKERPAYRYFSRAAKPLKGEKVASFERPGNTVLRKINVGTAKNICARFERILRGYKMKFWRKMDFLFGLTIGL